MKHVRYIILALVVTALFLGPAVGFAATVGAAPATTGSGSYQDACAGIGVAGGDCTSGVAGSTISNLLKKVINIISAVVGVIAVIMIVVGGFKYITSGGESSNVSGAKNTIIYAIIGLVIVAFAQIIVHFVINHAADATTPPPAHTAPAP